MNWKKYLPIPNIEKRNENDPPLHVVILAKSIPICKWNDEENLAKGEIVKLNFVQSQKGTHKFNQQVLGFSDGYEFIYRHIQNDWFKVIGKSRERTC